ncbi:hypothetical protein DCC62_17590 [candidate division KSB1 bacterium]|nr:MAG: hypothetical protein DCC62_17590 [candidate division KSB1 bacterium]
MTLLQHAGNAFKKFYAHAKIFTRHAHMILIVARKYQHFCAFAENFLLNVSDKRCRCVWGKTPRTREKSRPCAAV